MSKKRAIIIAPGRGTYNKPELGYFHRHHGDQLHLLDEIDSYRNQNGQGSVSELDKRETYSIKDHTRGDNASPLIFACAYADFLSIDQDQYEIVGVTGNSMGWYIALACAGALSFSNASKLINTMGTLMQDSLIGGQLIYPFVNDDWETIQQTKNTSSELIEKINSEEGCDLHLSINLGGMIVYGGNKAALDRLKEELPPVDDRFPLVLPNHAAFHTPLQEPIAEKAQSIFASSIFRKHNVPLIDGRGHIWKPHSTNAEEIYSYTLGHQVYAPYDFSKSVQVSAKEFGADCIIILGPGTTLGGAVAQSLIEIEWLNMKSKTDFKQQQNKAPYIFSMGLEEQRSLVV